MNGFALARTKCGRLFAFLSMLGLLSASAVATAATSGGAAPVYSYCANRGALFTDRNPVVGVSDPWVDADTPAQRDCAFGQMAASHVGYFREWLSWPVVEVAPNRYDFSLYDGILAGLARHHMSMLPMLLGTPAWRGKQAPGVIYPPNDPQAFAAFAALCAKRYGPHGSFWRANPGLPYYPVRAWEIWNEPNLAQLLAAGAVARLQAVRTVMNRFGDRKKDIWLTE